MANTLSSDRVLLSVIIPTHDACEYLNACLESVLSDAGEGVEVIVVDDGSDGDSVKEVCANFPSVQWIRQPRRLGFSASINRGIREASGEVIMLLNDDAFVAPGCLNAGISAFAKDPELAAAAPQVMMAKNPAVIESLGQTLTLAGRTERSGYGFTNASDVETTPLWGPTNTAAFFRRQTLIDLGLFDEYFVAYFEDADMNFRLQMAGQRMIRLPAARVYHHMFSTYGRMMNLKAFLCSRNSELVLLQNAPLRMLLRLLPAHCATNVAHLLQATWKGLLWPHLSGKLAVIRSLPQSLRKRRERLAKPPVSYSTMIRNVHSGWLAPALSAAGVRFLGAHAPSVTASSAWQARLFEYVACLLFLVVYAASRIRMLWVDRTTPFDGLRDLYERFAWELPRVSSSLWFHGEGIGEFRAAEQVIHELGKAYPRCQLVLSSGRQPTCEWLRRRFPTAIVRPVPWDLPGAITRWLRRFNPRALFLLEFSDGFSPGMLRRARNQDMRVLVLNASVLPASKSRRFAIADFLGVNALNRSRVDRFLAASAKSAELHLALGVAESRVVPTGNLKFDITQKTWSAAEVGAMRQKLSIASRGPVIVVGCAHAEEEKWLAGAFRQLSRDFPRSVLIVAPQDVGRSGSMLQALTNAGVRSRLLSQAPGEVDAVVVDRYGELSNLYNLADIAVVAGSFFPDLPGHSLVEPAALGKAIILGPSMGAQAEMAQTFLDANAVRQCLPEQLVDVVSELLNDEIARRRLGRLASDVVQRERGATKRTVQQIQSSLRQESAAASSERHWPFVFANYWRRWRFDGIDNVETLRRRLDDPGVILCLGNGPSSESRELDGVVWDSLFRVNDSWHGRRCYQKPDVIFTGVPAVASRRLAPIYGFRTIAEERAILARQWRPRSAPLCFATLERFDASFAPAAWPARPTNGVAMIAMAVALQPKRLIIAGIDLFEHPDGTYPGDLITPNSYAPAHDRSVEIEILTALFEQYAGELVIVGEPLRRVQSSRRPRRSLAGSEECFQKS